MPLLIAHRGSHESEPENTLAAFDAAAAHGATMIELDVRRTADGQLVIFHDPEVARTPLRKLTLDDLRSLSGLDVPVLEDVLCWAQDAGMGLDVELKEDGYVERIARLLADFSEPLIVTSFIDPAIAQLAKLAPDVHRGLLLSLTCMDAVRRVRQCQADTAVIEMRLVQDRVLAQLADADIGAFVWDFWPARHAPWLGHELITGYITDDIPGTRVALSGPRAGRADRTSISPLSRNASQGSSAASY